jgi:uncharacterized protein
MALAFAGDMPGRISRALKAAGFTYVALDLEGYRQGSLNEALSKANAPAAAMPSGT